MSPVTRRASILGPKVPGSDVRRREVLGELLRSRRERLAPSGRTAGIAIAGRRRTPGLRREEVAQLAGVSVAWYTWLEQGRDIHPSTEVLEAIFGALQLTSDERIHGFKLAGRDVPRQAPPPPLQIAPPQVQAVLDALAFPAYAADRAFNVLAWNALADELFGYSSRAADERNSLLIALGDPGFRAMVVNASDEAAMLVANFRRVHDEADDDPALDHTLARLERFAEFRRLWARHEIKHRHSVRKELRHPRLGALTFETQSYTNALFGLRLVVFVPDARSQARLASVPRRTVPRSTRRRIPPS